MGRRLMIVWMSLVGLTLAMGGNAWADRDRCDRMQRYDKGYHHKHRVPPGHHYGWHKGKGNPHWDRHHRWDRSRYRDRHGDRHYKGRYHRKRAVEKHVYHYPRRHRYVEKHIYHHYPKRHRHVEKPVYHHYPKRHRYHDDRYNVAVSVIDDFFGFGLAVSGKR